MIYPNLARAMKLNCVTQQRLADELGITGRAMRNKLAGRTGFTLREALRIKKKFFSITSVEELFETDEE